MDVKLYLKRSDSKTETVIYARISYHGYQVKYYLPEKILPQFWNSDTQRARENKKFPEFPEFNIRIANLVSKIKNIFRRYQNDNEDEIPTPDVLRHLLDSGIKGRHLKKAYTFFSYLQEMIDQSSKGLRLNPKTGKPLSNNTPKIYTTVQNHLLEYNKLSRRNIDFNTIDLDFYNDYKTYLIKKQLYANTIGKHIQVIKLIMNECSDAGYNTNMAYKSKKFVVQREDAETIYLSESELLKLQELDLTYDSKLDKVRDMFLIGCHTGLRFSDFSILKPNQIKDGFIETTQIKTGGTVVIPVHDVVKNILSKYNGSLPPAISNQKLNSYIKDVAKLVDEFKTVVDITSTKGGERVTKSSKKYQLISTHTARRSFATNQFLAGLPTLTIMAITGHKTEKAFLKYIKVTPAEHAKLMQEHWNNNKKTVKKSKTQKSTKN